MPTKLVRTDSASTFSTFNSAAFADAQSHVSENSSINSGGSFIPPAADQQNEFGENGQAIEGAGGDIEDNELTPQATITETNEEEKIDKTNTEADVTNEALSTKPLDTKPLNAKPEQSKQEVNDVEAKADVVEAGNPVKAKIPADDDTSDVAKVADDIPKAENGKEQKESANEEKTQMTQPEPQKDPETALVDKQDPDKKSGQEEGYHREHSECHEYIFGHCFTDYLDQSDYSLSCCWSAFMSSMCGIFYTNKKR
ncbi:hypothetical protein HII12_002083 [Brettanomyces bruxellensis]|uniref:Uncharacterized protein n=1 Tax=Dekkera bruxellensis TaxID=5007 RepID=A0A8H6BKR4_DEKBR|nr:uncharacterized protein BRETT_004926 [Brettanomyces bruxellensis]KAF6013367.1 hypothetical protein HII12_002083 [Brettanomyces bruxellensis]QOU20272.1 hypothetical protein BRETT_004926 [Brettanomyces bruxellensis]